MSKKDQSALDRRAFFRKSAGAGAAGAVALVATATGAQASEAQDVGPGYRESDHVKTYYDLARF